MLEVGNFAEMMFRCASYCCGEFSILCRGSLMQRQIFGHQLERRGFEKTRRLLFLCQERFYFKSQRLIMACLPQKSGTVTLWLLQDVVVKLLDSTPTLRIHSVCPCLARAATSFSRT